jgi:hypothetical protein
MILVIAKANFLQIGPYLLLNEGIHYLSSPTRMTTLNQSMPISSYVRFIILVAMLNCAPSTSNAQLNSLYAQSDFVFIGQIKTIIGPMSGDLGTAYYLVEMDLIRIYKQTFIPPTEIIQLSWIVSNLRCAELPLSNCITRHEGEPKIFFLNLNHFYGGDEIPDSLILPYSAVNDHQLTKLKASNLIRLEPFKSKNACDEACALCADIDDKNWNKVEHHITKHANEERALNWMHHRNIKWVLPDRMILASLPSYQNVRFLFITNSGDVEALVYYQVGFYKTYFTWIPRGLNMLFNAQVYHRFARENVDTLILKSFDINYVTSPQHLAFDRTEYERQIHDTLWSNQYGLSIEIDNELLLLASVYEGPTTLYEDYKTMPNYHSNATSYIDSLEKYDKVYSLCIMARHQIPDVATYSVSALARLQNKNAIPFLIKQAEYEVNASFYPAHFEARDDLRKAILLSLDTLTGVKTISRSYPFGVPTNTWEMSYSIPLWRKSFIRE